MEAELELGRRERLGRALLDAQGRIVAVNQAWTLRSAEGPASPPLARSARATRPPARPRPPPATTAWPPPPRGSGGVLSGQAAVFRCRYLAPDGAEPSELTVTPLADGDGAVVTHRVGGAVR